MKNLTLLLFFVFLLTSFSSPEVQRKLIRQNGYDIECYVVLEEINNFDNNKMYYWFRNSKVHNSMARAGGFVLHGEFKKFYRSQQLAEKGFFEYGLKEGEWRSWYLNGKLKSYSEWWDGLKHGDYIEYDSLGNKVIEGRYKRNNKHGEWINYLNKDTLKYKRGEIKIEKPDSLKKPGFFKRLFSSSKKDSLNPKNDTIHKNGFFKRLFSKKQRNETSPEKKEDTTQHRNFFQRLFGNKKSTN